MKSLFSRLVGILLVVAAAAGMLISLIGVIEVWRIKPALSNNLSYELDVIHATVSTTSVGLITVSDTMKTVSGNVQALQDTTLGLAQSIHGAQPVMDSLATLLGQDLPSTITATQTSLNSAASSALLIDNLMGSITSLPLFGLDKYSPAVPLHTALGNVSSSLGKINPTLSILQANLYTSKDDLASIENDVIEMGGNIEQIKGNMDDARQVIIEYQQENNILLSQVDTAKRELPTWSNILAWGLTIALVWLFITQIGLFLKGWEMLSSQSHP